MTEETIGRAINGWIRVKVEEPKSIFDRGLESPFGRPKFIAKRVEDLDKSSPHYVKPSRSKSSRSKSPDSKSSHSKSPRKVSTKK